MDLSLHSSSLPHTKTNFQHCFTLFLLVSVNGDASLPLPTADYSSCHTSFSLSLSTSLFPALSFLAPTCMILLSPSDYLSHFTSPQECWPLNAKLVMLSVPHMHSVHKKHRGTNQNIITILRRTRKLFHRLIFHGHFSVFVRIILVVGIKTEKCQSLSSYKIVPKKLFSFMCLFPPLI